MTSVILIGGGGNCKKIIDILISHQINIDGILDDRYENETIPFYRNTYIIGKISNVRNYPNAHIYITIGNIGFRKQFSQTYSELLYPNLFHKNAYISDTVKLGKGIIVHHGVYIGSDAVIGDFCHIDTNASVEHDCILGSNVMICPLVSMCGNSKIDNNVFVGTGTTINNSTKMQPIVIGNNSFIGSGSLITRPIPENVLYYGTPTNKTIKSSPHKE